MPTAMSERAGPGGRRDRPHFFETGHPIGIQLTHSEFPGPISSSNYFCFPFSSISLREVIEEFFWTGRKYNW